MPPYLGELKEILLEEMDFNYGVFSGVQISVAVIVLVSGREVSNYEIEPGVENEKDCTLVFIVFVSVVVMHYVVFEEQLMRKVSATEHFDVVSDVIKVILKL